MEVLVANVMCGNVCCIDKILNLVVVVVDRGV